jgi:hypothetical protein
VRMSYAPHGRRNLRSLSGTRPRTRRTGV